MKITVIKSSPHKNGSSNLLADNFIKGAEQKGHKITVFDAGHSRVAPCLGCGACAADGTCVQKDDNVRLQGKLADSDMAVFATPLYYFGVSAQLKAVIDRFYNINFKLAAKGLKSALIVAAWDSGDRIFEDVKGHYLTLCGYLHFKNMGEVLGAGCGTPAATASSKYPKEAYELGRSL